MRIMGCLKSFLRPKNGPIPVDTTSFEPLMAALKGSDPTVRRQAVIALGDRGDRRATEEIIRLLKDSDDDVRLEAVIALGKIGDARAVEPLLEAEMSKLGIKPAAPGVNSLKAPDEHTAMMLRELGIKVAKAIKR